MSYSFIKALLAHAEAFEQEQMMEPNVQNFAQWLNSKFVTGNSYQDSHLNWEGKAEGRSVESVINTSLVHLFRYAKVYSKIAVDDSPFTTIDDFIFLLNLMHKGAMSKMQLIDLNIHEKSTGMQIISRLILKGFVEENVSEQDKRSKMLIITEAGKTAVNNNIQKIRDASNIVAGNLDDDEKLQLAYLLQKLESFHQEKFKEGAQLLFKTRLS